MTEQPKPQTVTEWRDEVAQRLASIDLSALSDAELKALEEETGEIRKRLRLLAEVRGHGIFTSDEERAWYATCEPLGKEVRHRRVLAHQREEDIKRRQHLIARVQAALARRPKHPTLADVAAMQHAELSDSDRVLQHETGWRLVRGQSYDGPHFFLQDFNLYDWTWHTYNRGKKRDLTARWQREIASSEYQLTQADIDGFTANLERDMQALGIQYETP